jgi:hypothetical protein
MKILLPLFLIASDAFGFVLLSGPEKASLPATAAAPTISFVWDGSAPFIKDKDKIDDGALANSTDEEVMSFLLTRSLSRWSTVRGSFIKLELAPTDVNVSINKSDRVHAIVVSKQESLSTAASANPQFEDGLIFDCDIMVGTNAIAATNLDYTLTHEIGHCLGLGHPHSNYGSIMSYSRSQVSPLLGADDKAGVIYLYPDPAYSDNPSKSLACGRISGPIKPTGVLVLLLLPLGALLLSRKKRVQIKTS